MLYCANCQLLTASDCPRCGRKMKKLKPPRDFDPVFLVKCRMLHSGMIEPLLDDNAIPHSRVGTLGAALSTAMGSFFELYSIYVPFALYPKAYRLLTNVFGEDAELMARMENYGMTADRIAAMLPDEPESSQTHNDDSAYHN